jgi:TatD DNase family protein
MMDMHCHIDLYSNPEEIIGECVKNKLYVLSVTTTPKAWNVTHSLTKDIPRFSTALGLHPQLAHEREHELSLFDSLITETNYIGEIGLDASKEYKQYLDSQLRVFRHILRKCQQVGSKILTIHSRGAVSMVLDELERHHHAGTAILHWFLGSKNELHRALDLDCMFSVGPAMLKSQKGKKVIDWIPRDKILLETDGPFASLNNKQLRPIDSFMMIDYLAKTWKVSEESVTGILKNNLGQAIRGE